MLVFGSVYRCSSFFPDLLVVYKCKLSDKTLDVQEKDMEVVVRVFGEGTDQMLDREEELNILTQVVDDYVKCRFENGIVVTFFAGQCLRPLDLTNDAFKRGIANRMAQMHSLVLTKAGSGERLTESWFQRSSKWISMSKWNRVSLYLWLTEYQLKETCPTILR